MMKRAKKLLSMMLAAIVAMTLCMSGAYASGETQRATQTVATQATKSTTSAKNLRKAGLKFNLKKKKAVNVTMYARGGSLKYSVKVTNLKVTRTDDGKKKATFTVTSRLKKLPAKSRKGILKAIKQGYSKNGIFGDIHCVLVDYGTGRVLRNGNNLGVTWRIVNSKEAYTKTYYNANRTAGFRAQKYSRIKIEVTYPADYRGLCIGIGGSSCARNRVNKTQKKIAKDQSVSFYKTTMYKKDKKSFHFMRVR